MSESDEAKLAAATWVREQMDRLSSGNSRPMGVYDSNGNLTRVSQAPGTPHATMVEEATLSRGSLGRGASSGMSMRAAAVSRAPAVSSRGGFTSRFGGSGRSGGG